MQRKTAIFLATIGMNCLDLRTQAAVVHYLNKAQWQAAVNNEYRTISFTGYPQATIITTQYSIVGVTFPDANDYISLSGIYLNDGAGLAGNFNQQPREINITFAAPQFWIAADFPGSLVYRLYRDGTLIYTSPPAGGGGTGWFSGIVSDMWFNRAVRFRDNGDPAYIDDLYYSAVPAPGAVALFGVAAALPWRKRRRSPASSS